MFYECRVDNEASRSTLSVGWSVILLQRRNMLHSGVTPTAALRVRLDLLRYVNKSVLDKTLTGKIAW